MLRMNWLAVLVYAKECDIQVITGKLKVIRIAAKKGHLKFRCKNQPHVGVFVETIKVIESAGVESDHIEAHRSQANMIEPLGSEGESILGFDLRHRRGIEQPIAFVRNTGRAGKKDEQKKPEQRADHFSRWAQFININQDVCGGRWFCCIKKSWLNRREEFMSSTTTTPA